MAQAFKREAREARAADAAADADTAELIDKHATPNLSPNPRLSPQSANARARAAMAELMETITAPADAGWEWPLELNADAEMKGPATFMPDAAAQDTHAHAVARQRALYEAMWGLQ